MNQNPYLVWALKIWWMRFFDRVVSESRTRLLSTPWVPRRPYTEAELRKAPITFRTNQFSGEEIISRKNPWVKLVKGGKFPKKFTP